MNEASTRFEIKTELSKSFKSVNYSQWERQKQNQHQANPVVKNEEKTKSVERSQFLYPNSRLSIKSSSSQLSQLPERKCSAYCSHPGIDHPKKTVSKTRRQLQEEEERKNLLRAKIKFARESLKSFKQREKDLTIYNQELIDFIKKTEKSVNQDVDSILRRYERYQDVKKTIHKKHFEESEEARRELELCRKQVTAGLSVYESELERVSQELDETQELHKNLSTYKNQEYPEKLLYINNLRKKLDDINSLHSQERDNLEDVIRSEKNLMKKQHIETTKNIADELSRQAIGEMHYSLKDMAQFNNALKQEIETLKSLIEKLRTENTELESQVNVLKKDEHRLKNFRSIVFEDILKKRDICTPNMDVVLDIPKREIYQ